MAAFSPAQHSPAAPQPGSVVDVVVPVLNEDATLAELLHRLRALPLATHVICVDNGSTDRSLQILRAAPDVELIEHPRNLGYGASLRDGIQAGRNELLVIIDADLEYPPEAIPLVVAALRDAEVVYASRFLDQSASGLPMPWFRILGNRLVSAIFNVLYGQRITDLYTGFKGLRRTALHGVELERTGFEHVVELAARVARKGLRIVEIPIRYHQRRTGRSKMRHLTETLKFLALVVKYRLD